MPWTQEEETLMRELHARYGNDWSKISEGILGRSEFSCRSRWYSHILSPTKTVPRMKKESRTHIKKTVRSLEIDLLCKEPPDPSPSFALQTSFPSQRMMPFVKFSFVQARPSASTSSKPSKPENASSEIGVNKQCFAKHKAGRRFIFP